MHNLEFYNYLIAFSVTMVAGLSTGLGGLIIYTQEKINSNYLATALGFSAGVMLYLSLVEILPESRHSLKLYLGARIGLLITTISFFTGMLLIVLINRFIPHPDYFHIDTSSLAPEYSEKEAVKLYRAGILTLVAIAIHNFPEGIVTFIGSLHNPSLGIKLAIAIAIHNIPEGISVAIPIYYATNNKLKAVKVASLSGIAEPLGAIIGFLIFRNYINDFTFGIIFALIAGIMTYISIDELLPIAERYGEHKFVVRGLLSGMAVIALSLLI